MELFRLFGSILIDNDEANKSISATNEKAEKVGGSLSEGMKIAKTWGLALGAAAGAAAIAIGVKAFNATEELNKSLNGLKASTGESTEKMSGMRDAMLDIYNNNFGESFDDIGKAMSEIKRQTGLSGEELSGITKNALLLRDTFDFEVNESVRAANVLMKEFGLGGEAAYNLIAQGAQTGLDKNGDLLDTINEYSVHFQQLGLDSEEMFNMLANGVESGAFSVDKLGDAVKEFGIRSKDDSKTSRDAFIALGLDADTMTGKFAKGGETANAAFELVTKKLLEMKDPVTQNTTGVALFGTQWEDLGVKGMAALTNLDGKISTTHDSLNDINSVKYNTVGEAFEGIKRQLETSILIPMGEKILPILSDFANWIQKNMPIIKDVIGSSFDSMSESIDSVTMYILPPLQEAFRYITETIIPPLIDIFEFLYTEIIPMLAAKFQEWIPVIIEVVKGLWEFIKLYIDYIVEIFKWAWPIIKDIVKISVDVITDVIGGLLEVLSGVIKFVTGVFTGDWKKAWEGVKDIFKGVWDGIVGVLKGAVNLIISSINTMVRGLNKLKFAFPDWVPGMGGKSFGLNIQEIPMLAKGGNISDNGSVIVGENGPELLSGIKGAKVTPLDKSGGITVVINNPTLFNDRDADKLGDLLVRRLKVLGVT